jgi:hypothetical protein
MDHTVRFLTRLAYGEAAMAAGLYVLVLPESSGPSVPDGLMGVLGSDYVMIPVVAAASCNGLWSVFEVEGRCFKKPRLNSDFWTQGKR